jgi:hypothetical protein
MVADGQLTPIVHEKSGVGVDCPSNPAVLPRNRGEETSDSDQSLQSLRSLTRAGALR